MAKIVSNGNSRAVKIAFNGSEGQDIVDQTAQAATDLDAYKAVIQKVQEIEGQYQFRGEFTDLSDVQMFLVGSTPYKVFVFNVTTDIENGAYTFVFVEERPNAVNED